MTKKKAKTAPSRRSGTKRSVPKRKDLGAVIRDEYLAQERQTYDGFNEMVAMGGPDAAFLRPIVAYSVVSAAEQVLSIEDAFRLTPARRKRIEEDLKLVRKHYTRTLTEARKTLGAAFNRLYETQRREHNEAARMNLNSSNGMLYCYVVPKFNDDGTHEPLGPRDFPWGQTQTVTHKK
jgi:hypothetical protein